MSGGTTAALLREVSFAFLPIHQAANRGEEGIEQLLIDIGLDTDSEEDSKIDEVRSIVSETAGDVATLYEGLVLGGEPDASEIPEYIEAVGRIVVNVKKLSDVPMESLPDATDLGIGLLDHLVVEYLETRQPTALRICVAMGIVQYGDGDETHSIDYDGIAEAFEDPIGMVVETLAWDEGFEGRLVLIVAEELLNHAFGGTVSTTPALPGDVVKGLSQDEVPIPDASQIMLGNQQGPLTLDVPLLLTDHGTVGMRVTFMPKLKQAQRTRLVFIPYGTAGISQGDKYDVGEDFMFKWTVSISGSIGGYSLELSPGRDPAFKDFVQGSNLSTSVNAKAELVYQGPDGEGEATPIVGTADGSNLAIRGASVKFAVKSEDGDSKFDVSVPVRGSLIIKPSGGFVEKILPEEIASDFEVIVGWATEKGVYFQGGASLEVALPLSQALGPIDLTELFLALGVDAENRSFPLTVGTSAETTIGPFTATVKRIGFDVDVSFPEDREGKMGPLDVAVGFKPPSGAGVSVDAGPVTGGGYIEHEPDKHRYAGALQLEIADYTIKAVGLLKTKLPGGQDGYSFLLLITAELPPIQLGFGFTLNGVGGLLGVNRGMRKDPLAKAVRSGNLNSVLFPENVVANAQRIISDLHSIFPPKADKHVVGPMARFGWGTPSMLLVDVGIVLGIPTWKVAILGKIQFFLPTEDAAIVDLNLAVLGFLDIPGQRLEITASLYDSRIAMFSAKGDMALKSSWGDQSSFMLSMGGFHPQFDPPKSFPELDRIQAWIPGLDAVRVRMEGYLALTPNTFQVGAGVLVHAEAGPAKLHGELRFDALFQFNPFKFRIDFYAKFCASLFGESLGIELDGTLQGPKPLEITAKVTIMVPMLPNVNAKLDVAIGSAPEDRDRAESKVFETLMDELKTPQNWQAQLPDDNAQFVTIRQPESEEREENGGSSGGSGSEDSEILTPPLGGIAVRQTVVPLEYRVETFGNATPAGFEKFRVTNVGTLDGDGNVEESIGPTDDGPREKFAPAKYRKMSDSEKLSSEAFKERLAGHRGDSPGVHLPADEEYCTTASLEYENRVTDERDGSIDLDLVRMGGYIGGHQRFARFGPPVTTTAAYLSQSAVGRAEPTTQTFHRQPVMRVGIPDADDGDDEDLGVVSSEVLR